MISWEDIRAESFAQGAKEPLLQSYYHSAVGEHDEFHQALAYQISNRLHTRFVDIQSLNSVVVEVYQRNPELTHYALQDLQAYLERDPACDNCLKPLLYFKGYLAIQTYRVGHQLWSEGRKSIASFLQARASAVLGVDIHPAARLGFGLMFDHATGIVIGETAAVGNNVSMLHGVSLGGSGNREGKRHPTVGDGALISVGAKILGAISIGSGVKIGGGSVVLGSVPDNSTVVGVPAKIVGEGGGVELPAFSMDQYIATS